MGNETISRTGFAKGLAAGVVVAASLGILTVGEYTIGGGSNPRENGPASQAPQSAASAAITETEAKTEAASATAGEATDAASSAVLTPGTYTASAKGISSDVTLTVTFDETGIAAITADVSGETAGIGAEIGDTMIQKALSAQSAEIDGVAGATITSDAFRAALSDCMAQAGYAPASAEAQTEAETEAASDAAGSTANDQAAADAPFVPGTYTASAKGKDSDVIVNATFDETNILALGVYLGGENPEKGGAIGPEITQNILDAQSGDVDGVSGATVTSDAVRAALADCIAQAKE